MVEDLYIPNMKALGLVVSDKKIFESFILKPIYWPSNLLMQPTGTVWTTLIGDHPWVIPVKFGDYRFQRPTPDNKIIKFYFNNRIQYIRTDSQIINYSGLSLLHIVFYSGVGKRDLLNLLFREFYIFLLDVCLLHKNVIQL